MPMKGEKLNLGDNKERSNCMIGLVGSDFPLKLNKNNL